MDAITNKSLGQHWLHDQASLRTIVAMGDIKETDTVLEIGPGLGNMTALLVQQANKVIAVELDEQLAKALPTTIQSNKLEVVSTDIVRFNFQVLPPGYKVIANIPYYITSKIIRLLSESNNPPTRAVLLVQKEVAERIAAHPGSMSLLSVSAQYYWHVELGQIISAKNFTPVPKVDSQVLLLSKRTSPLFKLVNEKIFFQIVKAGFSQRRKTLLNSLSGGLHLDKKETKKICQAADIDPGRRAQTLTLLEWYALYRVIDD